MTNETKTKHTSWYLIQNSEQKKYRQQLIRRVNYRKYIETTKFKWQNKHLKGKDLTRDNLRLILVLAIYVHSLRHDDSWMKDWNVSLLRVIVWNQLGKQCSVIARINYSGVERKEKHSWNSQQKKLRHYDISSFKIISFLFHIQRSVRVFPIQQLTLFGMREILRLISLLYALFNMGMT